LGPADEVPPPDLAIEVEVTRGALDKLPIFAALGVPEVWRFDGQAVHVHVLEPIGSYAESEASRLLPDDPVATLGGWIVQGLDLDEMTWGTRLGAWIREAGLVRDRVDPAD
jgi:hypothetical protein